MKHQMLNYVEAIRAVELIEQYKKNCCHVFNNKRKNFRVIKMWGLNDDAVQPLLQTLDDEHIAFNYWYSKSYFHHNWNLSVYVPVDFDRREALICIKHDNERAVFDIDFETNLKNAIELVKSAGYVVSRPL